MAFDSTNVTKLPEAPISGDANFDEKADVFLPALVVFSGELDAYRDDLITYVEGETTGLDTKVANADASATAAANSASTAATKATEAATSATTAATKATESSNSAAAALASKNAAATSATSASTSASTASTAAGTASTKASEASASATLAGTKAGEAASSAGSASSSAGTATTKAAEATTSASTAATHASTAGTKATEAANSASSASTSATNSATSANTASTHAGNAASSATAAAGSATIANTKAGEASTSATSALTSANTATSKASLASDHKDAAAASATAAASSASTASTAATTATTKANEASTSASTASSAATTATTKASEAATSASTASTAASTATTKASEAAASAASIPAHIATAATESASGHVMLSSTAPAALGTAAKGSGTTAAKADHVHPTTGLMTTAHVANSVTGFGTEPAAVSSSTSGTAGTATTVSRGDHSHDLGPHTHVDAATGGSLLATTEPPAVSTSTSGAVGTATLLARADHSHDLGTHAHTGATVGGQLDHGAALTGLGDDDHPQYSLANGSRAFTAAVSGVTPTADAHLATKAYVDSIVAVTDAMVFKGVIDCSASPNFPAADRGHTYKVSVAGKIGGASGTTVEVGDMLICATDGTATGDLATVGANWSVIQTNIDGAVVGPASSTIGRIATFSGTTGKVIADGGILATNLVRKDASSIIADSIKLYFGTGSDLALYHDGTNSYIDNITGSLYIRPVASETGILIAPNGAVSLYYDNAVKLATSSTGVTVTGTMAATTVTGANVTSGADPGHTHTAYIPKTLGTAKGDLIGFSASATASRVGVGTDGQVLTADSTAATGVTWKEASGGFRQVFTSGNYTASSLDLVEVDTTTLASIITLPASGMVEVYDAGGNCAVNNITVKDASNNVLALLDVNYGDILFRYNTITSSWDALDLTDGLVAIPTASQEETANLLVSDKYVTPSSLAGFALLFPTHFARSTKFAAKAVSVSADRYVIETPSGYSVNVGGTLFHVDSSEYLNLSLSAAWDSVTTDYRVAANRAGRDFYIYSCNYNSTHKFVVSANSTYPAGYTANNSRKIGGFHCLCLNVGTISGHALSGYLTGDILPASVWDLKHRPVCAPEGMVYVNGLGKWVDIYLASVSGGKLVSAYNATCADGASATLFDWYDFSEWFGRIAKRLPTQSEFMAAALGSNEGTNIAGSADPGTTGGKTDTAGRRMISHAGVEDCCGNLWQWGIEAGAVAGTAAWKDQFVAGRTTQRGQGYQEPSRALLGGPWALGACCGSRGSAWSNGPLALASYCGARGVAEPLTAE